jgi:hypothetical protein
MTVSADVQIFVVEFVWCPADHTGREVWGMKSLRPLEHWNLGFESHSRHECLCAFILCLCVLYRSLQALRRADPSSKESYRLCIGLRNWKRGRGPTKGCRAKEKRKVWRLETGITGRKSHCIQDGGDCSEWNRCFLESVIYGKLKTGANFYKGRHKGKHYSTV